MIERAFIHVGGSPGSGKTALIEAVLARRDLIVLAARCSGTILWPSRASPTPRPPPNSAATGRPGRLGGLCSNSPREPVPMPSS